VNTPEFAKAQRQRKKVEALFAELQALSFSTATEVSTQHSEETVRPMVCRLCGSRCPPHDAGTATLLCWVL